MLPVLGGLFVLFLFYTVLLRPILYPDPLAAFWRSTSSVGFRTGWLGSFRSSLAALFSTRGWVHDGYTQFSKNNEIFALPRFGFNPLIVVPGLKVHTLMDFPESDVSQKKVIRDNLASTTGDLDLYVNPLHIDLIRSYLTRKLALITADVYDELVLGFLEHWPTKEDEWTSVQAVRTCTHIVSRAANRVFVGVELCRDPELLRNIRGYSNNILIGGVLVFLVPSWLRPLFKPLFLYPANRNLYSFQVRATPLIRERLARLQDKTTMETAPNDALQWLIEDCIKKNDPLELDPERICRRILRINMVAIHTTSTTITNTLLDLYASPRQEEFVENLREECVRVLTVHGGTWTKAAVNELYRIDSTIKESMRLSSLGITGIVREVVAKGGIDFGDDIHIPQGVYVGTPISPIHMDPEIYAHPETFDPFRFSRPREAGNRVDGQPTAHDQSVVLEHKGLGTVTTSSKFLSFGHGKTACPGRFFASQEMKLMLAHVVMAYDVRLGTRPKNRDIGPISIPTNHAKFEVRLRKQR